MLYVIVTRSWDRQGDHDHMVSLGMPVHASASSGSHTEMLLAFGTPCGSLQQHRIDSPGPALTVEVRRMIKTGENLSLYNRTQAEMAETKTLQQNGRFQEFKFGRESKSPDHLKEVTRKLPRKISTSKARLTRLH